MSEVLSPSRREAYLMAMQGKLHKTDALIAMLEVRAAAASSEIQGTCNEGLDKLRRQGAAAAAKLQALRAVESDALDQAMDEMDRAWEAFRRSVAFMWSQT
jgi:hypothetical protein